MARKPTVTNTDDYIEKSLNNPRIDVEYYGRGRSERVQRKEYQLYLGVEENPSSGMTCLVIKDVLNDQGGYGRRHFIEVGSVYAIALTTNISAWDRYVLRTPPGNWKIRAQEIKLIVEGKVDDWAKEYFDPNSDKFFEREWAGSRNINPQVEARYGSKYFNKAAGLNADGELTPRRSGGCMVFVAAIGFGLMATVGAVIHLV